MEHQPRDVRGDCSLSSEGTFSKSLEAQRSFDGIHFSNPCCIRNTRDSPNVGPKVLKMQSPVSPGCWTPATSGTVEKLFVMRLVPCLTDHASFHCVWAEQRGDGKAAERMCPDSQVVQGKYLAIPLGEQDLGALPLLKHAS